MVEVELGDYTFLVKRGECYSIDCYMTDLDRVSKTTYKNFTKEETSTRHYGDGVSTNVVYWYDDNGGMFFVKGK